MSNLDDPGFGHLDAQLGEAVGARAGAAPAGRPDFSTVLADRQQRLRRRTTLAATAILAVGVTGMAALAARGDDATTTADGPTTPSDVQHSPTTTALGVPLAGPVGSGTVWYCQGALDRFAAFPTTTTISPTTTVPTTTVPTTTALAAPADTVVDAAPPALPPLEDSGYFRECHLVEGGPGDGSASVATYIDQYPTTTVVWPAESSSAPATTSVIQSYVVQPGDYGILVADRFGVALDDLIAFNGWSSDSDFPFPGEEILIPHDGVIVAPPSTDIEPAPTTTLRLDDGD